MSKAGDFVWYDLMTTDPGAAQEFYGKVVGWGTTEWQGPAPYTMWCAGEEPIGGVMELPEQAKQMGAPPHWLAYVQTNDLPGTCARIKELGGNVLKDPEDIPDTGSFAIVADPQGAVFALYTPTDEQAQQDVTPRPGRFSWHELATEDPEGAWDFYSKAFGWEKTDAMDMGEMGIYQMYGNGDHPLGGMFKRPAEMPVSAWTYYAMVPDINAAVEQVTANGGQVLNGPMEVPGGDQVAQCMDPQGCAFALHAPAAGA